MTEQEEKELVRKFEELYPGITEVIKIIVYDAIGSHEDLYHDD
jgi:hypothetical protein